MKILVVGSGGREHALAWKLNQSERVSQIYVAPGNAGTAQDFVNVPIQVMDFDGLTQFAEAEQIDLVVVGPEDPLCGGLVDRFEAIGIPAFGPNQHAAQFEGSKDFTKQFLNKYDIPTAQSKTVTSLAQGLEVIEAMGYPIVIKTDGLAQGKGVVICRDNPEAADTLKSMLEDQAFGDQGTTVVIEEFLDGVEESLLCFVSNNRLIPMEVARDYKKIHDGDQGPNTGGVGAFSPVPDSSPEFKAEIKSILDKIEAGLIADGFNFNGILFIGFMKVGNTPYVLEFNVRFGDPETEVLMPRLESDLVDIMSKTLAGTLEFDDLVWSDQASVGVILHSQGYPGEFVRGVTIDKVPTEFTSHEILFHNGTGYNEAGDLVTRGGRVLTCVALADTIEEARVAAYRLVDQVEGASLSYRTDIAQL